MKLGTAFELNQEAPSPVGLGGVGGEEEMVNHGEIVISGGGIVRCRSSALMSMGGRETGGRVGFSIVSGDLGEEDSTGLGSVDGGGSGGSTGVACSKSGGGSGTGFHGGRG